MLRPKNTKMTAVDRKDLRDLQSFRHRKDAGVNEVDVGVVVFSENLGRANVVVRQR